MTEQNTNQNEVQPTAPQPTPQPIIINNVVADQPDDKGKKKAPGFIKVCVYSFLTCGIYFFYWLVKSLNGGYRKR
jgi:hypothetical protein|nr:MAG TPA: protein of unknown function (DUF4234) [Caudoviricetes sp.]